MLSRSRICNDSLVIGLVLLLLLAPDTAQGTPKQCEQLDPELYVEAHDPMEKMNRRIYRFNQKFDDAIAEPVAEAYRDHMPRFFQSRIGDFTKFVKEPRNLISALLQGRFSDAGQVTVRLLTNLTVGLFGTIDVASKSGVEYENHDFGHVLARWGVGDGAYFVVPFLGPTNSRDGFGGLVHNRWTYYIERIEDSELQTTMQVAGAVDGRAALLPFTDLVEQQPDPYIFVRESYKQNRLQQICNP